MLGNPAVPLLTVFIHLMLPHPRHHFLCYTHTPPLSPAVSLEDGKSVCVSEKKKKSRRGCDVILTPLSSSSRLRIESWREKRGRWDWKEALRRLQGKTCKKVGPILILYSKFENILQTFFFFKKINVVFFVWGIWLPVSDPAGSLHPINTLAWMLLAGCCTFGPDLQPHFAWTHFVPWRDSLYFCIYQRLGTNGDKEWKLITNQNVKY